MMKLIPQIGRRRSIRRERGINRRSEFRVSLLEAWNVDTHKALRVCEERHVTVGGSEFRVSLFTELMTLGFVGLVRKCFFEDDFVFLSFLLC